MTGGSLTLGFFSNDPAPCVLPSGLEDFADFGCCFKEPLDPSRLQRLKFTKFYICTSAQLRLQGLALLVVLVFLREGRSFCL